jgi:GTP pyrophosphokinase
LYIYFNAGGKVEKKLSFFSQSENRGSFFARIGSLYPESDKRYCLIKKAYDTAKDAFRKKYRESGERYFEHLRCVALIQIDMLYIYHHPDAYILNGAALLHDIVEDIPSWPIERVREEFGEKVAELVDWLTKRNEKEYHERFINAPRNFFLVKLPDRLHNMLTIWSCSREKILRKIEETEKYYLPFAEQHLILARELHEAVAQAKLYAQEKKE